MRQLFLLALADLGIERRQAFVQHMQGRGLPLVDSVFALSASIVEGGDALRNHVVDPDGFLAQGLEPAARMIGGMAFDFADLVDRLDEALFETGNVRRPAFAGLGFTVAQVGGQARGFVAYGCHPFGDRGECRSLMLGEVFAAARHFLAEGIRAPAHGRERLDFASVEVGAKSGASFGQRGEALAENVFEMLRLAFEGG
ncbi:MAG: hypothetical protein ABIT09_00415, partial [Croceibacterium sp.]